MAKFDLQQEYDRKAFLLRHRNKTYQEFCKKNELKPLSYRMQAARWNREEAAKARGAATKYSHALESEQQSDIIKSEVKALGIKGEVTLNPEKIDTAGYSFDDAHINLERGHSVSREMAEQFIKEADLSVTRWNGQFINYYGSNGATYIDVKNKNIRTAFLREQYDDNVIKMMEVLREHENK